MVEDHVGRQPLVLRLGEDRQFVGDDDDRSAMLDNRLLLVLVRDGNVQLQAHDALVVALQRLPRNVVEHAVIGVIVVAIDVPRAVHVPVASQ